MEREEATLAFAKSSISAQSIKALTEFLSEIGEDRDFLEKIGWVKAGRVKAVARSAATMAKDLVVQTQNSPLVRQAQSTVKHYPKTLVGLGVALAASALIVGLLRVRGEPEGECPAF